MNGLWYLARGTGVVSLLLLTVVVVLGITTRSGRPAPGLPRFAVAALHRNASLLAVVLLTVHIGTLLLDPYAQLRLIDVILPFDGARRPLWLGLGTLAFDLIAALVVTSLLRHRLGRRGWRAVHWLAYAAWPAVVLHGLGNGTDAGYDWFRAVAACCVAAVVAGLLWRCSAGFAEHAGVRRRAALFRRPKDGGDHDARPEPGPAAHRLDRVRRPRPLLGTPAGGPRPRRLGLPGAARRQPRAGRAAP